MVEEESGGQVKIINVKDHAKSNRVGIEVPQPPKVSITINKQYENRNDNENAPGQYVEQDLQTLSRKIIWTHRMVLIFKDMKIRMAGFMLPYHRRNSTTTIDSYQGRNGRKARSPCKPNCVIIAISSLSGQKYNDRFGMKNETDQPYAFVSV
jgi:hypothetical protein